MQDERPEIQMQTLNQDIKNGSFRPVYLLYGDETFLVRSYKNRLTEAIAGDVTMNFNYVEGQGLDVREIISLGYAAEFSRQDAGQLARWAGGILAQNGRKIRSSTMELFLEKTGDDMENIRMELEKLICYTMGREEITAQDVEEICTVQVTNKIFDMVTAIVTRNPRKAMDLYEDLLTLKEPPMRILFLIARQFNQLLQVKDMSERGADRGAIASRMKIAPFIAGKLIPQARAFSREQILSYVRTCVEYEEAVKSGWLQDRLAVELLITKEY